MTKAKIPLNQIIQMIHLATVASKAFIVTFCFTNCCRLRIPTVRALNRSKVEQSGSRANNRAIPIFTNR